jgi:hypothetical protein
MPSGNFVCRPAGAHPARLRVSPPEPGASLAPVVETRPARRRQAHVRAVGLRPRNLSSCRMPRERDVIEGHNAPGEKRARRGASPAGCSTRARTQRTVQEPGRPSPLLDTCRSRGAPVTRLRRTTGRRVHVSSAQRAQNTHPHRGRPPARGTGAGADGGRESEGGIGAWTSGNGVAAGPGRAQAARVEVHVRRDPCPMPGHWRTGHRDAGRERKERNAHPQDGCTRWRIGSMCRPSNAPTTGSVRTPQGGWMGSPRHHTGSTWRRIFRRCTHG